MIRQLFIVGLVITLSGCGGDRNVRVPIPTGPSGPPPAFATAVTISGNTSLTEPGQTSQLTATATLSDGTSQDVTSQAIWGSTDRAVVTVSAGLLTAVDLGEAQVDAQYQGRRSTRVHVTVLPAGTYILKGTIKERGNFTIPGARVEIIGGPFAGKSTTASGSGFYRLPGVAGDLTLRVTKEGYEVRTQNIVVMQHLVADIELTPTRPPFPMAGVWHLTLTADDSCRLPSEAGSRSYTATLTQDGARVDVTLSDAEFASATTNRFSGRVAADSLAFTIAQDDYYYYYDTFEVVEKIGSITYLSFSGSGSGTAGGSTISGTFNGSFTVYESPDGFFGRLRRTTATCSAQNHRFVFRRN